MHLAPQLRGQEKLQAWARSLRHPAPTIKGHIRKRSPPSKLPFFFSWQLPRSVINFEIQPPTTATTPPQPAGTRFTQHRVTPPLPGFAAAWTHICICCLLRASSCFSFRLNYLVFLKFHDDWTEFINERRAEHLHTPSFTREGINYWTSGWKYVHLLQFWAADAETNHHSLMGHTQTLA